MESLPERGFAAEGASLLTAARNHLHDSIAAWRSRGGNIDAVFPFPSGDWTALQAAVMSGDAAVVSTLLQCGASTDATPVGVFSSTMSNFTPLQLACRFGYTDVASVLLAYAADTRSADEHGQLPLHFAAAYGHAACVRCLLDVDPSAACVKDTVEQKSTKSTAQRLKNRHRSDHDNGSSDDSSSANRESDDQSDEEDQSQDSRGSESEDDTQQRKHNDEDEANDDVETDEEGESDGTNDEEEEEGGSDDPSSTDNSDDDDERSSDSQRNSKFDNTETDTRTRRNGRSAEDLAVAAGHIDLGNMIHKVLQKVESLERVTPTSTRQRISTTSSVAQALASSPALRNNAELAAAVQASPNPAAAAAFVSRRALRLWLSHLGVSDAFPSFLRNGYDDICFISAHGLTETDCDAVSVTLPGHRRKLMTRFDIEAFVPPSTLEAKQQMDTTTKRYRNNVKNEEDENEEDASDVSDSEEEIDENSSEHSEDDEDDDADADRSHDDDDVEEDFEKHNSSSRQGQPRSVAFADEYGQK